MKKIYFFLAILLVAGFSACTEDIGLDVAPPQSYPQESPQEIDGFNIAMGSDFNAALVLTGEEKELQVVKATAMPVLAEGATVVFKTEISDTKDFGKVVELPVKSADNAATTLSSDLSEAVKTLFNTKAPVAHSIYFRSYFYILDGTSASMMPTPAVFGPCSVTPYSNVRIESAYYLIGNVNGWNMDNLDNYKFSRSDKDVYDDPIFTITVLMPENCYFKIVPQSSKDKVGDDRWNGVLGNPVDGNTELEGMLVVKNAEAMRVLEGQMVKITLNMMESTYTIELLGNIEPAYYLIGNINGWNINDLDNYKFSHSGKDVYDDPIFTIKVYMSGADKYFKIVSQSCKDAGSWDGVLGNPVDGNTDLEGILIVDGGAMRVMEDQWVNITLNMREYTYKIDLLGNALQQLYVPGGHQGWNPGAAPIVYSPNLDWKFDGYVYMEAGNMFKFTAQPNWDGPNYGTGDGEGKLSDTGGDLSVPETGFYRFTVNLNNYTYTATSTNWGLIGDATAGGWDTSTAMNLNAAKGEWTVTTTLAGGKAFKFRANNGWDINLGGDVNKLTYGGDNIPVASDGTYLITLKLGNASAYICTVVKQ
jgi:hypothetical protein